MGWSRAKANKVLPREALVIANTIFQQHKRKLYIWPSLDGQYRSQIDYILCSQRWRSSIQSAKTRLGIDCGSDHEFLIAKFRLKLKKVGKTRRRQWHPTPVLLPGKSHGWRGLGLQSMGSLGVGHDWATSFYFFTFMHWRRKWQPTPVFLPGESQGRGSLVGCCLWGCTETDMTEAT